MNINKNDIESQLRGQVSDRFIELWWFLRLPGLGGLSPKEVYDKDPLALYQYACNYQVFEELTA